MGGSAVSGRRPGINGTPLVNALFCAAGAAALAVYVAANPVIPIDVTIDRDIQAIDWGPLALTVPVFTFISHGR